MRDAALAGSAGVLACITGRCLNIIASAAGTAALPAKTAFWNLHSASCTIFSELWGDSMKRLLVLWAILVSPALWEQQVSVQEYVLPKGIRNSGIYTGIK
jgi:hypothetical protein